MIASIIAKKVTGFNSQSNDQTTVQLVYSVINIQYIYHQEIIHILHTECK